MASPPRGALAQSLALGLVADLLLACGLMMMKIRADALPMARGRGTFSAVMAWIRDPVWIGGLAVQAAGYALYMVALAGAPVSMMAVAMQGGIALFVVLAVALLGERARIWEWLGIGAFLVAVLMLAGSLNAGAPQGPLDARALAIASVAAVAITLMLLMLPDLRQNGAATAIASGIALGFAGLYTKPLADRLASSPDLAAFAAVLLTSPYTYLTIVTNVAGLVMLQNSFAMGRGIIAMPLSSAISNVIPIAGGIAVFGEKLPGEPFAAAMRAGAFVLTIVASAALAAGDLGASASR
jgi:drug/metabolite transporter (DMT)-like permease